MKKILFPCLILLSACFSNQIDPSKITTINIVDRNGLTETICKKERLEAFQNTDFLSPQPYQKVLRVYGRDKEGNTRSYITSYHPNGQVKQSLEVVNNRAFGLYREWHPNGKLKIDSFIIGGVADINTQAEESFIFEGKNTVWDDEGHLVAEIFYDKGILSGESKYYHPNGTIWKSSPYVKNVLHGTEKITLPNGHLFQINEYKNGKKEGDSLRYWENGEIAFRESYRNGLLMEAQYFNKDKTLSSEIVEGKGFRSLFGKDKLEELQEFRAGVQEGIVKIFDDKGHLVTTFEIKEGEKQGEEINYFLGTKNPKLLITWNRGILQGPVKTWYENGRLESLREVSQNKKNGHCSAWYVNGTLMLVEEYDNDKLLKGEYYRVGEKIPYSKIEKGKGIATLFDGNGNFSKKIYYQEGKPID